MPKRVMGERQIDSYLAAAEVNPYLQSYLRQEGITALEYYQGLGDYGKNAMCLLVHAVAFLDYEAIGGLEAQKTLMASDARRKGESGPRLLEISNNIAETLELMRLKGRVGRWFYVPQAGDSYITYGLDASGVDWMIEDISGHPTGFKVFQAASTPSSVAKKEASLAEYYGEYVKGKEKLIGLFPGLDESSNLIGPNELMKFITKEMSTTRLINAPLAG